MGTILQNSSLPKREQEICVRFAEIRKKSGLSQASFAKEIGIPLGSVSNYEYGKTAVRADIAQRACYSFLANERWLATGEGDWQPCVDIFSERSAQMQLNRGELYSKAYDRILFHKHDELEQLPNDQLVMRLLNSDINTSARLERVFSFTQHLFGLQFHMLQIQALEEEATLEKKGRFDQKLNDLLRMNERDFICLLYESGITAALNFFSDHGLKSNPIIPVMRAVNAEQKEIS